MADSIKRVQWSNENETHDRISFYLFQKAKEVVTAGTAGTAQMDFCERIYNQSYNRFAAAMICASNATIGAAIDAGTAVSESDIDYVVATDQWVAMADAGV